jgi:hypothetical protein
MERNLETELKAMAERTGIPPEELARHAFENWTALTEKLGIDFNSEVSAILSGVTGR